MISQGPLFHKPSRHGNFDQHFIWPLRIRVNKTETILDVIAFFLTGHFLSNDFFFLSLSPLFPTCTKTHKCLSYTHWETMTSMFNPSIFRPRCALLKQLVVWAVFREEEEVMRRRVYQDRTGTKRWSGWVCVCVGMSWAGNSDPVQTVFDVTVR